MNTTIIINGGAGRVIAAIPALEKFQRLNPSDDFRVLVYGWESLYWSHPELQARTFSIAQKGAFQQFIRNNRVICPEPYYVHGYYNQKLSLAEAFDAEINHTTDHADLTSPRLFISTLEKNTIERIVREKKQKRNKSRVMVIQPYGSGMGIQNNRPFDSSQRSLDVDDYLKLVTELEKNNSDLLIFYFGNREFKHPGDLVSEYLDDVNTDLRFYLALIDQADLFVGCDSVGQHMARALNKPGIVMMGATDEVNVSYPDYFDIFRNGKTPEYSPIRLSGTDCEFADRQNDGVMKFSEQQLADLAQLINRRLYE
jgi:ADP-heptose:LPS heptosyltransferase